MALGMKILRAGPIRAARALKRFLTQRENRSLALAAAGSDVSIGDGTEIEPARNVMIGDHVFIGRDCWFTAPHASITIGSHVIIAPQVALITGDHRTDVVGSYLGDVTEKTDRTDQPIFIEDDVWIGFRAIILKGVTLGRGCVVGAGSVVTRDIPPYAVAMGNPARVMRFRFDESTIVEHERRIEAAK
jgi:acetyltransferase-like isoleucine patch superfamily enzyme